MTVIAFDPTRTDNAILVEDLVALGYLRKDDRVLDATYGKGRWWRTWKPDFLIKADMYAFSDDVWTVDYRKLPFVAKAFDAVTFDPPYKLNGTSTGRGPAASDADYGVHRGYRPIEDVRADISAGAIECARVCKRNLIVKCQDQISSGQLQMQTQWVVGALEGVMRLRDVLHVYGMRAQPAGRRQVHARRNYSTALVFVR